MSVTDPLAAPARSASPVSGQRNPSAAKTRHSAATTAAAPAARRSLRPAAPDHSSYTTQDSIENQTAVWTARISANRPASTGGGTHRGGSANWAERSMIGPVRGRRGSAVGGGRDPRRS